MKGDKEYILLILVSFLVFGIISVVFGKIQLDEREFHLPTAKSFYGESFFDAIIGDDYKTASTPLPYIITASLHKAAGIEPALWSVRGVNIAVSFLTMILLISLLRDMKITPFPYIAVVFFYPYFLKPSFTFHMAGFGLLFYVLFLKYVSDKRSIGQIISGLALCCAILSQQFYLILAALPFLQMLLPGRANVTPGKILSLFVMIFICLVPVLILFFIWGGLTHPNFRTWGVQFSLQNLTGALTVIGVTFFPVLMTELKNENPKWLVAMGLAGFLFCFFFFPKWSSVPGPGSMPGMTFNLLERITVFNPIGGMISKTFLIFWGLFSIKVLVKSNATNQNWLMALGLMVLAFSINKIPSERHMLPMVVTAMIMMFPIVKPAFVRNTWLPYQALIGIIYFIYMMFFTPG